MVLTTQVNKRNVIILVIFCKPQVFFFLIFYLACSCEGCKSKIHMKSCTVKLNDFHFLPDIVNKAMHTLT